MMKMRATLRTLDEVEPRCWIGEGREKNSREASEQVRLKGNKSERPLRAYVGLQAVDAYYKCYNNEKKFEMLETN